MEDKAILRKNLFNTIVERGYFYQCTSEEEVKNLLEGEPTTVYMGIDPTADSLHIGHCFPLFMLRYLQEAGHRVIILLGGATAMVGDPTGKSEMRSLVESDFVEKNFEKIKKIIGKFLKLDGDNPAILVNNAEWFKGYDYVRFMREIGIHFNVNKMLATDAYSKRLEQGGLTFFEMGYMLMQAYDFLYLNKNYGCTLQVGGSDQWANILAGVELGRKVYNLEGKDEKAFQAFTVPLLTNSDGVKMGKTVKGALWVDENKTSPFEFYQYFYNVADQDTEKLLKCLTRIPLDEIKVLMQGDIREAKRVMAFEVTKVIFGEEKAKEAMETARQLFTSGTAENAPTFALDKNLLDVSILDLLVMSKLTSSKGEAKRLIEQGGIFVGGNRVESFDFIVKADNFKNNELVLRKGKKTFVKVVLKWLK